MQWSCRTQARLGVIILQVDPISMFAFFPATLNCTGQAHSRQSVGFNQGWVLPGKYKEASEREESGRCVYKSDYREG